MTTTKRRLNISLPPEIETAIKKLAKKNNIPEATEAARLLELAIQIEEDEIWNALAEQRDTRGAKFVSHRKAWA
jgi:hypothetical protein